MMNDKHHETLQLYIYIYLSIPRYDEIYTIAIYHYIHPIPFQKVGALMNDHGDLRAQTIAG